MVHDKENDLLYKTYIRTDPIYEAGFVSQNNITLLCTKALHAVLGTKVKYHQVKEWGQTHIEVKWLLNYYYCLQFKQFSSLSLLWIFITMNILTILLYWQWLDMLHITAKCFHLTIL